MLYIFSIVLGLGAIDPVFGDGGATSLIGGMVAIYLVVMGLESDAIIHMKVIRPQLMLLVTVYAVIVLSSLLHTTSPIDIDVINVKLISLVVLFWFLSYHFACRFQVALVSLMLFAFTCVVVAALANAEVLQVAGIGKERLTILGENPNATSARMALAAVVITYVVVEDPLKWRASRLWVCLGLPILVATIVASGSRGSMVALVIGVVVIVAFSKLSAMLKLCLSILSVGLVTAFYGVLVDNPVVANRLELAIKEGDLGGRSEIWEVALGIFLDNPLLGVGETGYRREMLSRYHEFLDTHNLFLYLLVTGGVVAFLPFMLFITRLFAHAVNRLRATRDVLLITVAVFAVVIASKTGGALTYTLLWYLFAIIESYAVKRRFDTGASLRRAPRLQ